MNSGLSCPGRPPSEDQRKPKEINTYILPKNKKAVEHEGDSGTSGNWCTWNGLQRLDKGAVRAGNQRTNRDHPDYSIIEIGQNTEKCFGDLRRLAVTQTPMKDHQLNLMGKTHQEQQQ